MKDDFLGYVGTDGHLTLVFMALKVTMDDYIEGELSGNKAVEYKKAKRFLFSEKRISKFCECAGLKMTAKYLKDYFKLYIEKKLEVK